MKLVILDRDGVINEDSTEYIKSYQEWRPLPGSLEAIARLNQAGFTVAVATNQSGLARGLFDEAALQAIHNTMFRAAQSVGGTIDKVFYCPHSPSDHCLCRKPKPGLLQQIADHYGINLAGVPYVGDSERDLEAARRAGAVPVLVLTGNGQKTLPSAIQHFNALSYYENLLAFSTCITFS